MALTNLNKDCRLDNGLDVKADLVFFLSVMMMLKETLLDDDIKRERERERAHLDAENAEYDEERAADENDVSDGTQRRQQRLYHKLQTTRSTDDSTVQSVTDNLLHAATAGDSEQIKPFNQPIITEESVSFFCQSLKRFK